MPRPHGSRNLDERMQRAIVAGRSQGATQEELAQQFGLTKSGICRLLRRWKVQGGYVEKKRSGRPRVTDSRTDQIIARISKSNPRLTATDIFREISSPNLPRPSLRTIRRRLQAFGLHGRRPVKKPMISVKNRKARVEWAKAHLNWTRQQWSDVLWSDESKYLLFGTDGIKWIRRPVGQRFNPKYQLPTMKHGGGSVMVWGCFSARGMGPLHHVVGIMDRHKYIDILEKVMHPFARRYLGRGYIYQQDNDPKHRSRDVQAWFDRRRVTLLDWPSQSPDLNIIEPMWEELERRLAGTHCSNTAQKFAQLEAEWRQIPQSTIDKLIDSMPRRCQAVIDSFGYATKY